MYNVSYERLPNCNHYIFRLHPDDGQLGDDYVWCCTGVDERNDTIRLTAFGGSGSFPLSAARQLEDIIRSLGFKRRIHERRSGGVTRKTFEKEL